MAAVLGPSVRVLGAHGASHFTSLPLHTTRLPTQIIVYDSTVPLDCVNESLYTVVNNLRLQQEVLCLVVLYITVQNPKIASPSRYEINFL